MTVEMSAPSGLRVEHLDHPLSITMSQPRLSWRLPLQSTVQLGYQVPFGDWDSGRVDSSDNVLVSVGAPPLTSRERRRWRVRVWTDLGDSPRSEPPRDSASRHVRRRPSLRRHGSRGRCRHIPVPAPIRCVAAAS
jgi:hypothetical protein